MGFGPNICRWVGILCNSNTPLTRFLRINGQLSEPFHICSGVPQGDIWSPICFACIMEPLARMIKSPSSGIRGINVGGIQYRISLYADDTVIFLSDPRTEIPKMWTLIRRFEKATGLRVNDTKTEGVTLGATRFLDPSLLDSQVITWAKEGEYITCLGAPIGYRFDVFEFYSKKYRKFKSKLARWSHRTFMLPTESRIPLASAMLLSLFWFNAQTLVPSRQIATFVQQDIDRFIWKRSPNTKADEDGAATDYRRWIRKQSATLHRKVGGLSVPDWDSQVGAIQANWLVRYLGPAQATWKPLLDHWLTDRTDSFGREVILSSIPTRLLLARLLPSASPTLSTMKSRLAAAPPVLHFWRAALSQFRRLSWKQAPSGPSALAIPVFSSPLHPPPQIHTRYWRSTCGIEHIRDLWNFETNTFWTVTELAGSLTPPTAALFVPPSPPSRRPQERRPRPRVVDPHQVGL